MYLNVVYYGHGYWGDVAAARGYFGKTPYTLDWAQASLLAGLPQAPSAYDPLEHLELSKERQRHVLDRLVVNDYLTAGAGERRLCATARLEVTGNARFGIDSRSTST